MHLPYQAPAKPKLWTRKHRSVVSMMSLFSAATAFVAVGLLSMDADATPPHRDPPGHSASQGRGHDGDHPGVARGHSMPRVGAIPAHAAALRGLPVRSASGEQVGIVEAIIRTAAGALQLEIRRDGPMGLAPTLQVVPLSAVAKAPVQGWKDKEKGPPWKHSDDGRVTLSLSSGQISALPIFNLSIEDQLF